MNDVPESAKSQCERLRKITRAALRYEPYSRMRNTTNFVDMAGTTCGTIFVVEPTAKRSGNQIMWACVCMNCGKEILVPGCRLRGNRTQKSCGCLTKKILSEAQTRHGMTDSPTWRSWKSMMDRCFLKTHKSYARYGGRGVLPCEEWSVFENFYRDMGERPKGTTLGRIDNSLGYFAANCRWETTKQQTRNRRSTHYLEIFGEKRAISEWCEMYGIEHDVVSRRLAKGWSAQDAVTKPKRKQKNSRTPIVPLGHQIEKRMVEVPARDGKTARVAEYFLQA